MEWSQELIVEISKEKLLELLIELLSRMGFKNCEKVSMGKEWGIDIVALREDPLSGTEKVVIKVHNKGLATSSEVSTLDSLVDKYKADRGVLISPAGFTKDARLAVSRNYRGRILLWDGEKLLKNFNNYGVDVPEDVGITKKEGEKKEKTIPEIELDAPLLQEVSLWDLMGEVQKIATKIGISKNLLEPVKVEVKLRGGYIISWKLGEERDRALIESENEIITSVSSDPELKLRVQKVLLDDKSKISATEKKVEINISPIEAVMILKSKLATEREVSIDSIEVLQRKKVYIPVEVNIEVKAGANMGRATVKFDLTRYRVEFNIKPLSKEFFERKTRDLLKEKTGEEVNDISVEIRRHRAFVRGETNNFRFEIVFNVYTGVVESEKTNIKDEAVERIILSVFPKAKILEIERSGESIVADIEDENSVRVLSLDPATGKLSVLKELPLPQSIFHRAKALIEENFPISGLTFDGYEVKDHAYMIVRMKGDGGKAGVKVDPQTGDVLDYYVEIDEEKAKEIALEHYPNYRVREVKRGKSDITVRVEDEKEEIILAISLDGKYLKEKERELKRDVIEGIAREEIKKLDESATLNYLMKDGKIWKAGFSGKEKVGEIVISGSEGKVVERIVHFTEMAIEEFFKGYIKRKYGEKNLITERISHHKEKNYINIKLEGSDRYYYARISTDTMEIQDEDTAPKKGLGAKLKQFQLESKYK